MTPEDEIAYALETEVELLPHIPELLADLDALGSDPHEIVELLRALPLPERARVLDLGSGKGAVAIAIASALGHRVTGVELFSPFVRAARASAEKAGVGGLCEFREADLRSALGGPPDADALVFSALGDLLGPPDVTIGLLRTAVRPGGYLVIGDAYVADERTGAGASYGNYFGRSETLRRLELHGDRIVREVLDPPEQVAEENRRNNAAIRARAEGLKRARPELGGRIDAYVARQEQECRALETEIVCATWVLARSPG